MAAMLVAVALFASTGPVAAELVCGPRANLVAWFAENFKEVPVSVGLTEGGTLLEVLASPTGTWTMLLSFPSGQACVVETGEAWENVGPRPAAKRAGEA
ncbi:MAG: hypothetical protein ACT4P2_05385 [Pseudomonadota bacterium]